MKGIALANNQQSLYTLNDVSDFSYKQSTWHMEVCFVCEDIFLRVCIHFYCRILRSAYILVYTFIAILLYTWKTIGKAAEKHRKSIGKA